MPTITFTYAKQSPNLEVKNILYKYILGDIADIAAFQNLSILSCCKMTSEKKEKNHYAGQCRTKC